MRLLHWWLFRMWSAFGCDAVCLVYRNMLCSFVGRSHCFGWMLLSPSSSKHLGWGIWIQSLYIWPCTGFCLLCPSHDSDWPSALQYSYITQPIPHPKMLYSWRWRHNVSLGVHLQDNMMTQPRRPSGCIHVVFMRAFLSCIGMPWQELHMICIFTLLISTLHFSCSQYVWMQ
jgi:hypothetical protein